MSADDERVPPLTAQQLGLCGPLSDDPEVEPDTARHHPPADDLAAAEQLCRTQTLPGDARGALDLLLAEYDRRGAAEASLTEHWYRDRDRALQAEITGAALSGLLRGMARRVGRNRASEVRVVTALRAEVDSLHDENAVLRGEKPHAAAVIDRMREQAGDIKRLQVAVDLAHAALVAEEAEHESFRDQIAALRARVAAARSLADDLPISEYAADQIRAVLDGPAFVGPAEAAEPAPRAWAIWDDAGEADAPEPALIGTWADPEFRAHQDHKHPVEGCGYCPSEEDR